MSCSGASHTKSSCSEPFYAEMNSWQRSVKRKYDTVITDEIQRNQKNDPRGASGEVTFPCYAKDFIKEGLPGFSETHPLLKLASYSSDGLVLAMADRCERRTDSGPNKLVHNLGPHEPGLSLETEHLLGSVIETEDVSDIYWHQLHKKKGSQHFHGTNSMDTEDSSLYMSSERREELRHLSKNHRDMCSPSGNELILLRQALRVEHEALNALYIELEEERNASAVAAHEAINMIARLQEEKATMQMETHHYKMMVEERGAHDEEAIALLKDILTKKEEDILVLEDELEAYRQVLQKFELEGWGKETCQRILFEMGGKEAGLHLLESKKEESMPVSECFNSGTSSCSDTAENVGSTASHNLEIIDQMYQACPGCLDSDTARRNTANKFDDGGCGWEDRCHFLDVPGKSSSGKAQFDWVSQGQKHFHSDFSKGVVRNPLKRAFYLSGDSDNWRERKSGERGLPEEECDLMHVQHCPELDTGGTKVTSTKGSREEKKVSVPASLPPSAAEEQEDRYVWERVTRLEERLEHLGEQQQHQREWLNENTLILHNEWAADDGEVFVIGSNGFASNHWKPFKESGSVRNQLSSTNSASTVGCAYTGDKEECLQKSYSLERLLTPTSCRNTEAANADRNWCKLQDKTCQDASRTSVKHAATQDLNSEELFNQEELDVESEESCIQRREDVEEGVHDVYEVLPTFRRSRRLPYEETVKKDSAAREGGDCPGMIDSSVGSTLWETGEDYSLDWCGGKSTFTSSQQLPVGYETGILTDRVLQSVTDKCFTDSECHPTGVSLDVKGDHTNMPVKEVQQVTLRLQALESERGFMKQAIESLRKENGELKLLQQIAQQLRELKGTVEKSEQPKEPIQREQLSFLSIFKNIWAFTGLQCNTPPQDVKLAYPFQKSVDSGITSGDHVGLSHLLEKSPSSRMVACLTRGLKVKLPLAEGAHSFQTF